MGESELVELRLDGIDHIGVAVAQARHRRAARRIEIALAGLVDQVDTLAADGARHGVGKLAMENMGVDGHCFIPSPPPKRLARLARPVPIRIFGIGSRRWPRTP